MIDTNTVVICFTIWLVVRILSKRKRLCSRGKKLAKLLGYRTFYEWKIGNELQLSEEEQEHLIEVEKDICLESERMRYEEMYANKKKKKENKE